MKQLRQLYLWRQPASDSILAFEQRLGRPGWVAFVHLAWTAWVFLMPAFSQPYFGYDLRWALLTLSSFPLFLWLYVVNVCASHRAAQRASLGMVALCVVLLPWYPGGLTYFVFGCVMYRPRLAGLVRQVLAQLVAALMVTGLALLIGYPWQALVWIVVITPIIGILVAVDRGNRERDAALKQSQDEVRRLAAVAERERISRDLHDLLGHTLSMVALKSDLAERLVDNDPDAARAEMAALADIARHALSEVRRAVSGMRATGIAAELAAARLLLETAGIEVDCQISPDRGRSADRKSTRLNSSHVAISYAVFCLSGAHALGRPSLPTRRSSDLAARAEMAALADIARHALSEVRRAVSGMRATGIAAELAAARLLLETAGIEVDCQISPDRGRSALSPGAEHALAMRSEEHTSELQSRGHL